MGRAWMLLAVLLLGSVHAQPELSGAVEAGPTVTVLVHHPYPDAADPFGFAWPEGASRGAFAARHQHLDVDRDGFDFPTLVVDGITLVEGLPEGGNPEQATLEAYDAARASRATAEPAVILQVAVVEGRAMVQAVPHAPLDGESLHLWVALVEDRVHYEPPAALSNGVFVHPYTVRAMEHLGVLNLSAGEPDGAAYRVNLDAEWDVERLFVAAWVQQGAGHGTRFDAHEVVQSAMHPWTSDAVTRQVERSVLMEVLSATWCDPCLFGDRAIEAIALANGVPSEPVQPDPGYWVSPSRPWLATLAVAAAGIAMFAWNPRRRA